ncbi:MAG: DUF1003 domain-containing protein [Cytophagales bacterium]|nr:MAG: DUF1003 domain-containing protein [Cytophagales bacterium]
MEKTAYCPISGKEVPISEMLNASAIRDSIKELIKEKYPTWDSKNGVISIDELNKFRANYVKKLLENEKGDLSILETEVVDRINNLETLSKDTDSEVEEELSFGQRVADKVAEFGGSWTFILSFGGFIFIWIVVNVIFLSQKPFDPYPFILLNLILSCLAALQAPVIMMSQNRQETKDRIRSQHDYQVNLKAELEIRQLHEKIDHLLIYQSQKLFEIQQIQVEMMAEILKSKEK